MLSNKKAIHWMVSSGRKIIRGLLERPYRAHSPIFSVLLTILSPYGAILCSEKHIPVPLGPECPILRYPDINGKDFSAL